MIPWRGPWLSLVLLCLAVWCLTWAALDRGLAMYTGAALAQLPPRGITPTPRHTPSPTSTPVPQPTIPVVWSPTPTPTQSTQTGIWTQWRVVTEYRETPDGPWILHSTQYEQGTDRKTVTLTLWRYKQ